VKQFGAFRLHYPDTGLFSPYLSGISWDEAVAFCRWLSRKEGRSYRLPTEAEWEYVCRAGSTTLFSAGDRLPPHETANRWGVKNMHTGVLEWCLDWHGAYPGYGDLVDPVGPSNGIARVVRGGRLQEHLGGLSYYARSANRAGAPPGYRGSHLIGF